MRNVKISFSNVTAMAVAGFLASAMVASADNTVTLTQNPALSFADGGAFNAATSGSFAQNYAPVATQGGGFETFCIESTVTFAPNVTYYYDLSQQDSKGRSLTLGAAFLYYDFATGQLPGYFTASDTSTEAGLLQSAIWELQYNQSMSDFPSYTTDPFYTLATNTFGGAAGAAAPSDGAYNVDVLQMWDSPTSQIPGTDDHQNQLVFLGVPDAACTGALFGAAALSLVMASAALKRRQLALIPIRSRRK
jgi:hypothetical protein